MKKIKNYFFIRFIIISLIANIIVYLLTSFMKWDILWIKEIPKYSEFIRVMMILFFLLIQTICTIISKEIQYEKT